MTPKTSREMQIKKESYELGNQDGKLHAYTWSADYIKAVSETIVAMRGSSVKKSDVVSLLNELQQNIRA